MATRSYHNCPICKTDIEPGEPYRVIGIDMSETPPVSIYAHRTCIDSRDFTGAILITSAAQPGRIIQPQLSLALA
jgi:hypothetical protein